MTALEEFQERDSGWALTEQSPEYACFAWAVITALYPSTSHSKQISQYPTYASVLNFDGIEFPMTLRQIARFERNNNVSVNVFTAAEQGHGYVPLHLTSNKKKKHVNLLYVPDQHNGNVGHFAWRKNLSRLVSSQLSKMKTAKYICDRCLHYFRTSDKLAVHTVDCKRLNNSAVVLPAEGNNCLKFENYNNKERVPIVVYADLECVLEKQDKEENASSAYSRNRTKRRTHLARTSIKDTVCSTLFATNVPMANLTPAELERFRNVKCCHVCEQPFERDDMRVRDHCHLTGRFRGPAHFACNLNYKQVYIVPVVFHNLSGYDAHFIIKDVATAFEGEINVLPVTKETYISFTKHVSSTRDEDNQKCVQLRFIDSHKFLSTSLETLASYLDKSELRVTRTEFSDLSTEDFELLTRKGVFPYEYVDSGDKLLETSLAPREAFYSSLTSETVTESEYAHATNVWQRFNIDNLGSYSDLYLKTDVLVLADVFENFRRECIASYGLDPAHYYTLPGYTWDAMLKYTCVTFELLTDIDMVMFVERGIRGGLSQCSNRYARANNKYARSHDPSEPTSYLMYYDVNNLYGDVGCILEVDLTYPKELHDAHRDLPFCPTRKEPPSKHGKNHVKLLATVFNKKRYVIHYLNLQQCLRYGLRLTRIHRVLRFSQSPWLHGYIELNTRFRANATNELENVRKYTDVRLVTKWEGRCGAEALIAKPNFHSRNVFAEDLVAIELRRLEVLFNKPLYVGMYILDISKTCLYEFHYDYMTPLYGYDCKILYTDTDSLIYHIKCEDVYDDMKRDIARFDTSDYLADNLYNMPRANKKVPGLMKDENNGAVVTEFVGLRAKMYATRVDDSKCTKKVKGMKRSVVARTITFDNYVQCLRNATELTRQQSCIRSQLHEVFTLSKRKLALSPHDDKRYIIQGSTDTLPWGHYKIPNID
ncbi:uncharacterized protein LOC109861765 [Pseudomyrmex gracilis]|uniref:uncharacterized protein LOC109861765 n=1 Tax=Pseudomyrmex gracilis TaxID=219809 RepID=UPI0009956CAD|nr:uncharacterized protein LOC109861765 [Pseudomyrmex gracilis]